MKIGIWGYYGFNNLGDDLILNTLLDCIKKINSNASITVLSKECNDIMIEDKNNVKVENRSVKTALIKTLQMDVFIIGGGGIFPANTSTRLLFYFSIALIMKIRRKKVACIGVGIEEKNFSRFANRILLKLLIRLCDDFSVRQEKFSSPYFYQWKNFDKVVFAADMVFSNEYLCENKILKQNNRVIFSTADIFDLVPGLSKEKFIIATSEIIESVLNRGYSVCLVSFTNTKDQLLNEKIEERVNNPKCVSIPYVTNMQNTMEIIASSRYAICMRFHAIVLALKFDIPVCAIAYADKSNDVMERLGLNDYYVKFADNTNLSDGGIINLDASKIINIFDNLVENEENIKEDIKENIKTLVNLSYKHYAELEKLLNE